MANLDNNVNINNANRAYTPNLKKGEEVKPQAKAEIEAPAEMLNDGTQAADSYGRILVRQTGKIENPEMVKTVQDAIDFYIKNSDIAAKHVKNGDIAYCAYKADGEEYPYEDMCCISCENARHEAELKN